MERFDALIIKKMGKCYSPALLDELDMLSLLERKGVKMFSSPAKLRDMISRLGCTLRLREHQIPMPKTLITEDINLAVSWIESHGPSVFKPLYSTKARGMKILEPHPELESQLKVSAQEQQGIIYLQQIKELKGRDHGLVFLNGQYLGAYSRVGDGSSWNTTTISGGKYEKYEPSPEIVDLAQRAQDIFGLDFTSVDVAITDEGPIIFEVSAFGGYRGLHETHGINASELLVQHVMKSCRS
jgi:ribosomal protein S6--L-glutamate ligase